MAGLSSPRRSSPMFDSTPFPQTGMDDLEHGPAEQVLRPVVPEQGAAAGFAKTIAPSWWIRIPSGDELDQVPVLRLALGERCLNLRSAGSRPAR